MEKENDFILGTQNEVNQLWTKWWDLCCEKRLPFIVVTVHRTYASLLINTISTEEWQGEDGEEKPVGKVINIALFDRLKHAVLEICGDVEGGRWTYIINLVELTRFDREHAQDVAEAVARIMKT